MCGEGVVVVVVVVRTMCMTKISVDERQRMHSIGVAEHMGASSRRPRHPFSTLMAEVKPGPCTCVHGLQKKSSMSSP